MKVLSCIITLLCTIGIALSAEPAGNKFEKFQSLSRYAPIDLDDTVYDELTSAPRDYHVAILLTALEARYGCILCREFQSEWELIAKSWNKADQTGGTKLLFGTLDFNSGKNTFQRVCVSPRFSNLLSNFLPSLCFKLLQSSSCFRRL
jgi:oligosaccharyltransferase complex subunit gamma